MHDRAFSSAPITGGGLPPRTPSISIFGTAATVTAIEWLADQADLGAEPVSNPGVKLFYPLYPRIRPASRVPDQVCRVLVAADTSVHEENAARVGAAGMSAQVVVPQVLGRDECVSVYR